MDTAAAPTEVMMTAGLTETEATARQAQGLANTTSNRASRSYGEIIRSNVFIPIHNLLFVLGTALVLLGRPLDAVVTVAVITFNIIVGIVQEVRAKRQLDRIALLTRPTAHVVRDGAARELPPDAVVLGDLLVVAAGDQIIVDGQIVAGSGITVDESLLTGEAEPVTKFPGDIVYAGSYCITGTARYLAQEVGVESTAGRLTEGARTFRIIRSPLQQTVAGVLRVLLLMVGYLLIALVIFTVVTRLPLVAAVQDATVITGLVPTGLLLAISVAYALSAVRLADKGVLVQQANAVESLSNVDVFCMDKTGTLTANRLVLREVAPLTGDDARVRHLLGQYAASTATPTATSQAILTACPAPARPLARETPFSSARKWSALAFADPPTGPTYVLGAPEILEPHLASAGRLSDLVEQWTAHGLRVLLLASTTAAISPDDGDGDAHLPDELQPLALLSFADELRPEAQATLQHFIAAGVTPKIISGDHPQTVTALARQAGLGGDLRAVAGPDLAALDDAGFDAAVRTATVFGRITPEQKQRIIATLRRQGHYVAMTGDGVNDVLSLKEANLGIAMQSGSQATRSVADMVLLRDSFAALPHAVTEGQRVINGMETILKLYLARMAGMMLFIMLSATYFPLMPRQNGLIALLGVGVPTLLLAAWAQPGPAVRAELGRRMLRFVLPASLVTSLFALLVFGATFALTRDQSGTVDVAIVTARSTVTIFLVACSLVLVLFVAPPNQWWAGIEPVRGDPRISIMVVVLLAVLLALPWISVPGLGSVGNLFEIQRLQLPTGSVLGAAVLAWTLVLRTVWRLGIITRMVGL
ncbi:MAG: HAD-IC family P-type ATPase [Chloroflexi bacterium]|nr:HAD-IC family P-type ATPase [Chloroflexota bacterium]